MKLNHIFGGALLVAGTTIGAAMLAIPVAMGFMGFTLSLILFLIFWLFFLITAIFFIDVNLIFKGESNLISMAQKTLGPVGMGFTWVLYLLLLYSLTAAYIAASAPLFVAAFASAGIALPVWLSYFILPAVLGAFIFVGTLGADLINRVLMILLFVSYFILVSFVFPHLEGSFLTHVDTEAIWVGIPVVVVSFGYHIIIPTLSEYMQHSRKNLIYACVGGSLITLVIYTLWQLVVLGLVPLQGGVSIASLYTNTSSVAQALSELIRAPLFYLAAHFFSFFAIATSFLGVSLSLADFLRDGFSLKHNWEGRLIACTLTFAPPLFFVFASQRSFYLALEYAAIFVILLLGFLPAAMAWNLPKPRFYQTALGKVLIIAIATLSLCIAALGIYFQLGNSLMGIEKYFIR